MPSKEEIAEQERRTEHRRILAALKARKPGSKGWRKPKGKKSPTLFPWAKYKRRETDGDETENA